MVEFKAYGEKLDKDDVNLDGLDEFDIEAAPKVNIAIGAARSAATSIDIRGIKPNHLVELQLEGGLKWISRLDDLEADFPTRKVRGRPGEHDSFVLPTRLGGGTTRSGGDGIRVEKAAIFDIDLAKLAGKLGGKLAAPAIAKYFDDKIMPAGERGVFRLAKGPDGPTYNRFKPNDLLGDKPVLVFIHGTFSSTEGSFGGLWQENDGTPWAALTNEYGDRMVAHNHHTLALSPIANAVELVNALPTGAKLHLVSHSRGGMITELLARANRIDPEAGSDNTAPAPFDEIDNKIIEKSADQKSELVQLHQLLVEKKINVERIVRVAAPAAGTTLASGRLDKWLSIMASLVDMTGLGGSMIYRAMRAFLLTVARERTNPKAIPGLEAMMPGSPLTRILNRHDIQCSGELSVVAGDIEGKGILGRLAVWMADQFYKGDHDLVVNTASMMGGAAREGDLRFKFEESAPEVNHVKYFKNNTSACKISKALIVGGKKAGFDAFERPTSFEQIARRDGSRNKPHLFVLPGILGSHLKARGNRVWLSPFEIARGRIRRLRYDENNPRSAEPDQPIERFYGDLCQFMGRSHQIELFPYDWRISLQLEARRLATRLRERMIAGGQPVRIIAHSMGGLVARLAFQLDRELWQQFIAEPDNRLVMLGTPTRGSHSIVRMLLGKDKTTKMLDFLDFDHDHKDLLKLIAAFPGVLELLPIDGQHVFNDQIWQRLGGAVGGKEWAAPAADALTRARETLTLLEIAPLDADHMIYVAGKADRTPMDFEIVEGQSVTFVGTPQGDGRVPWDTGIPNGLSTYYVDAVHGDLPSAEEAFDGYLDLLQDGATSRLSSVQPADKRGRVQDQEIPDDEIAYYPDDAALEAAALGGTVRKSKPKPKKIKIKIIHGTLTTQSCPVLVGHYQDDVIAGAERILDRALGGRLEYRRSSRVYPGPPSTAEVVFDPKAKPSGAIVTGLGKFGSMTPGSLKRAISHGLRRYFVVASEQDGFDADDGYEAAILLVGSGEGGIGVAGSLTAILEALFDVHSTENGHRFSAINIIELYEDRAIEASHRLNNLIHSNSKFGEIFDANERLEVVGGGRRRMRTSLDESWYRRIQIQEKLSETGAREGLKFEVVTDLARTEVSLVPDTLHQADIFVQSVIGSAGEDHLEPGRTLFELLVPRKLKNEAANNRPLILMLDKVAAGYPWEMMDDGDADGPMAARHPIVRQLSDEAFRHDVTTVQGDSALVIGDPGLFSDGSHFDSLPGARDEGEMVTRLLQRRGFDVQSLIQAMSAENIKALMTERYRILHVASHGVFDELIGDTRQTGIVLGDGQIFPPGAVNQLSHVPDLVFLNCCHIGRVNAQREGQAATRYHQLAANIATQFIKIGTKAVVAAGWAVDDDAASAFARHFYTAMLAGDDFGNALKIAREAVYQGFSGSDSWGAYQAYGDPSFKLRKGKGQTKTKKRWVSDQEVLLELGSIRTEIETATSEELDQIRQRLDLAEKAVLDGWKGSAELQAALGAAFGELREFGKAIKYYDQAIKGPRASVPIRTVEQLANLLARSAVAIDRGETDIDPSQAPKNIARAKKLLDQLIELLTPNNERCSNLASAFKRESQLSSTKDPLHAIKEMTLNYRRGFDAGDGDRFYPLSNWLLGVAIVRLRGGKLEDEYKDADIDDAAGLEFLEEYGPTLSVLLDDNADFWRMAAVGDFKIVRALLINPGKIDVDDIAAAYKKAADRAGSPRAISSVIEHVDFIISALTSKSRSKDRQAALEAMQRLQQELVVLVQSGRERLD